MQFQFHKKDSKRKYEVLLKSELKNNKKGCCKIQSFTYSGVIYTGVVSFPMTEISLNQKSLICKDSCIMCYALHILNAFQSVSLT